MRLVWILSVLAFLASATSGQDLAEPGPYQAGYQEVSIARPGGSTFTARLFYPATAAGEGNPIDVSGGPYPAISFGHGFFQAVSNYQSTLRHLATHGYLVIATNSQGGLFPNHAAFAEDMLLCLAWLEQQNATPESLVYQLVATNAFGLSGHSMGGGAAILAADDSRVCVVVPLAAANTNPSAVAASANVRVPLRHIVGSADSIVSAASTRLMYDNTPNPRQFVNIQGGFHCGFIDAQGFGCDSGSMSRSDQLAFTRRLLTEFFDLYLKADQSQAEAVWRSETHTDPRLAYASVPDSEILPSQQAVVLRAGSTAHADITLVNLAPGEAGYEIHTSPLLWAQASPPTLEGLGPLESVDAAIVLAPPFAVQAGQYAVLVSARSLRDGGTHSFAQINVTVTCGADLTADGVLDFFDIQAFLAALAANEPDADTNVDGAFDFFDVLVFLDAFSAGC